MGIVIYTKPGCPYCAKARDHYSRQNIPFEERNAQDNPEHRRQMLAITGGDPTVPVVVEDGRFLQSGWEGRG